jgi:hypothetical protein
MPHMRKTPFITGFCFLTVLAATAGADASRPVITVGSASSAAMASALDRVAAAGNGVSWRDSLARIEATTATLVDLNARLTRENRALNAQLSGIQSAIASEQRKNADMLAAIDEHRKAVPGTDGFSRKRKQSQKEIDSLAMLVASARARLAAVNSGIALHQLKVQELELEKRILVADRQSRSGLTMDVLRQSIQAMKDRIEAQQKQTVYVRQKISELNGIDRPYIADAKTQAEANAALRSDQARLAHRQAELSAQISAAIEKKASVSTGSAAAGRHFRELHARKAALDERVSVARDKKAKLTALASQQAVVVKDLPAQIKGLETENTRLEEKIGNMRENIAVLEYRINTVTRYKNRNSSNR